MRIADCMNGCLNFGHKLATCWFITAAFALVVADQAAMGSATTSLLQQAAQTTVIS